MREGVASAHRAACTGTSAATGRYGTVHYTTVQQDVTAGSFAAAAAGAGSASCCFLSTAAGCLTVRVVPFTEAGAAGVSFAGGSQALLPFFKAAATLPKCSP